MVTDNGKTKAKPRRRSASSEKTLQRIALDTILEMVGDTALKPSDRLSAVKALLDYIQKQPDKGENETVRVIFENLPEGFAD